MRQKLYAIITLILWSFYIFSYDANAAHVKKRKGKSKSSCLSIRLL